VDPCFSNWGITCPLRVSICPAGDFEWIREGCGGCCDYIWIQAIDVTGIPVWGVPITDYYIQACDPTTELCLCEMPILADSITDENGFTTISGPIAGGGCVGEGSPGLMLSICGQWILEEPLCAYPHCEPITIVSPDLNADCLVNLSDLALFGATYGKGCGHPDYNDCADYNDDCMISLSDLAYFGAHYQHTCFD
jgi:hypothetical protein